MPCTNELDRAECVGEIIYQSSTAPPININSETTLVESHGKEDQENGSANSTSHSNGMKKTKTLICNREPFNYIKLFFFTDIQVFFYVFRKSADRSHSLYTYHGIGYCHSTSSDQMYSKIL